jgi:iron complex transport system ATP-binding protein
MILAANVGVQIGGRALLRHAALGIAPGAFVAIIGPNGAGKSTVLRAAAGELRPAEGGISIDGVPIDRLPRADLARRRAVLPQAVRLAFPMLVEEVVALGRTPHFGAPTMTEDNIAIDAAIVRAGISFLCGRMYDTLSGGEQQRVNLARVFAQVWERQPTGPRYLLLDEPTAPLDVAQQHHVLRLVRELADSGIGVCAVLHDLNQAATWADTIVAVREGRCVATGAPPDVITEETLESIYALPFSVLTSADGALMAQIRSRRFERPALPH